jgi:hypothetical protein
MANRLETFKRLAETYRQELTTIDATIVKTSDEIAALRVQLQAAELRLEDEKAERFTHVEQLRGIVTVIRGMEDREREKRLALEAVTVAATREIEDNEYGL